MSGRPLALVTGASSGIGADLAQVLVERGHDVVLAARSEGKLRELAAKLGAGGARAEVARVDLAEAGASEKLVQELGERGLAIDVLVNNAGLGHRGKFAESDPVRVREQIMVNMLALTELTRALVPGMLSRGRGRVLNIGSTAGFMPGPGMAVYYATKAYVMSYSEALAFELQGTPVTVTCACPGPTATGFAEVAGMGNSRLFRMAPPMTSRVVAELAVDAMLAGKGVYVTGFTNWVGAVIGGNSPRGMAARFVARLNADR
jgi:short-subunit dehydrogenase